MGKTVAEIIRTQDYVYQSALVRPHSEVLDFTAGLNNYVIGQVFG